jgi:hypothetical protein
MTKQIQAANAEVVTAQAIGDFYWTREGAESCLSLVDGPGGVSAWVCNVEFFHNGVFEVRGLKIGGRQFEPNKTVLRAKTRDDVEAALIKQCQAHVREYAEIDARREQLVADLLAKRVYVTERAALQRVNRALAREGSQMKVCRESSRGFNDVGRYYVMNQFNAIEPHANLEGWARDLGVLKPFEEISVS